MLATSWTQPSTARTSTAPPSTHPPPTHPPTLPAAAVPAGGRAQVRQGSNSGPISSGHARHMSAWARSSSRRRTRGKKGFRLLALATVTASSVQHASASDCPCASRFTSNSPVPETGPKPSCPEREGFGLSRPRPGQVPLLRPSTRRPRPCSAASATERRATGAFQRPPINRFVPIELSSRHGPCSWPSR